MSLDIYSIFDYPDLDFVDEEIDEDVIHFIAKPKHPNKICCPNCGSMEKNSNGNYTRTYQDLPMLGKHVMIHVETKEYLCRNHDCETVSYVPEFLCGKKKTRSRIG